MKQNRTMVWRWLPVLCMAIVAGQMAYWNHSQAHLLVDWAREQEGRRIWDSWLREEKVTPRLFLESSELQKRFVEQHSFVTALALLGPNGVIATYTSEPTLDWASFIPRLPETLLATDGRIIMRLFLRSGPPMGSGRGRSNRRTDGPRGGNGPFGRGMGAGDRFPAGDIESPSEAQANMAVNAGYGGGPFELVFDFPEPREDIAAALHWQVWLWLVAWAAVSGLWLHAFSTWQRLSQIEQDRQREAHLAAVGRVTARLAHEIKNPLGAVRGMTQVLSERLRDQPELQQHLQLMESETTRLEKLARNILDFSRPAQVHPVICDLRSLLYEIKSYFLLSMPCTNVELKIGDSEIPAWLDPDGGRQILLNLLTNACEAAGTDTLIEVSCRLAPAQVVVCVEDRGPGIDPAIRDTLFEPFVSTKSCGNGLGLAISRRLAERMGGSLTLVPREGGGCRAEWSMARTELEEPRV